MLFATGIVVAVGLNIGLLSMVRTLWSDSTVRVGLESVARQSQPPGDLTTNLANAGTALRHADLVQGGELRFTMAPMPR